MGIRVAGSPPPTPTSLSDTGFLALPDFSLASRRQSPTREEGVADVLTVVISSFDRPTE